MFLAHDIDVSTKCTVLCLNVVVANQSLIKLVLKETDLVLVLFHLSGGRSNRFQMLTLLSQL